MKDKQKQEHSFELRSEKVRSIVGQIPSSLVRYGITAIGLVLFVLGGIAYFLPYKKIYTGTAIIRPLNSQTFSDSIETVILLRFDGQALLEGGKQAIHLTNGMTNAEGVLLSVSSVRDTLDRQEAQVRFVKKDLQKIENQTVDFKVSQTSGSILSLILGEFLSSLKLWKAYLLPPRF